MSAVACDTASDPFTAVFGVRRGSLSTEGEPQGFPPVEGAALDYLAEAHRLGEYWWPLEELDSVPDFQAVLTSALLRKPRPSTGGKGCQRVHVGIYSDDEDGAHFSLLIVDRFGEGFEEPYETHVETFESLDLLLEAANVELANAEQVHEGDVGVTEFTEAKFAADFLGRLS